MELLEANLEALDEGGKQPMPPMNCDDDPDLMCSFAGSSAGRAGRICLFPGFVIETTGAVKWTESGLQMCL